MEKLESRDAHNVKVAGSSPASATKLKVSTFDYVRERKGERFALLF